MTKEALDKIKKGIKDSNISIHIFNLIMMLIKESEKKIQKPCKCCGKLTHRINFKNQPLCIDCSH